MIRRLPVGREARHVLQLTSARALAFENTSEFRFLDVFISLNEASHFQQLLPATNATYESAGN